MTEDHKAEAMLLGCCLLDGVHSLGRCLGIGMRPKWFSLAAHQIIFWRLTQMLADGKPIEPPILAQELSANRELDHIGGYAYIAELGNIVPTSAGFSEFLSRIRDFNVIRGVNAEATRLVELCRQFTGGNLSEIVDGPISRLLSLAAAPDSLEEPTWRTVVSEAGKAADTIINSQKLPLESTISWPWPAMDQLFEPMQRGQLIIVGARPSIGKSSLARQIVTGAALARQQVYFNTLEVRPLQVALQIASSLSRVGVRDLAKADPGDQNSFKEKLSLLQEMGITPSSRDRTLARAVARMKALAAGKKIDIAVIDHGGLLEDIALANTRDEKMQAIGRTTKTLKILAGELNIVVVLLWQLNRLSANDANREPRISDLRDSGSLEEDADKVILIHRPSEDPLCGSRQPEASDKDDIPRFFQNIVQAKGRDDGTSIMSFYFRRRTATFEAIEKAKKESPAEAQEYFETAAP